MREALKRVETEMVACINASPLYLGGDLSPEAVRRLACDAHIIPAVLGGAGQPRRRAHQAPGRWRAA
jgi:hypothetical protein